MDSHRPGVTDFVHIGLVVEDLDETVRFLSLLGFDCGEPATSSGEWIDRIIGLENTTVEVVMARGPDGSDVFEVVRFHAPSAAAQEQAPAALEGVGDELLAATHDSRVLASRDGGKTWRDLLHAG